MRLLSWSGADPWHCLPAMLACGSEALECTLVDLSAVPALVREELSEGIPVPPAPAAAACMAASDSVPPAATA